MKTLFKGGSVIVADDDPMIRGILRSKLEAAGLTVFVANNGLEVVELAAKMQAALILLDLNMPKLNGLLACQRIRQLPGNADTPIVVLTSHTGKDAETATERVGATAFLAKPFRSATLLAVLSKYLPLDVDLLRKIQGEATRAEAITQTPSMLPPRRPTAKPDPVSPQDQGKAILDMLRG